MCGDTRIVLSRGALLGLVLACAPLEEGQSTGEGATGTTSGVGTMTTLNPTLPSTSTSSNATSGSASGETTVPTTSDTTVGGTTMAISATTGLAETTVAPTTSGPTGTVGATTEIEACSFVDSEDNDDQGNATDLPALGCDDGEASVDASLEPGDPDWFDFFSEWDCGGGSATVDASINIDATLCVYANCTEPGAGNNFSCNTGVLGMSEDGTPGCCGGTVVSLDANCANVGVESIDVWMLVDDGPAACVDYTLTYEVLG